MSQDISETPSPPVEAQAEPVSAATTAVVIESPPPAAQPASEANIDPRARLHQLAVELMRNRNRRLLIEFLQLRRALQ